MLKFLRDKLKNSISKISKKIDEEGEIVEKPEEKTPVPIKEVSNEIVKKQEEPKQHKKGFFGALKERFSKKEDIKDEKLEQGYEEIEIDKIEKEVPVEV
ncbi:MAG: signal recognition particle-docking protein FtsY, partial [Nanoarchaeota archaeon]